MTLSPAAAVAPTVRRRRGVREAVAEPVEASAGVPGFPTNSATRDLRSAA
ncbi:hypothetical protein [Microbacterium testaceum]|nr:hypothetical protein [Microbacterium testaceum]